MGSCFRNVKSGERLRGCSLPIFAFLLFVFAGTGLPASAGAPVQGQSVYEADDLQPAGRNRAVLYDGLVLENVLTPRPTRPKPVGGPAGTHLLSQDASFAFYVPREVRRLPPQRSPAGNSHASAWSSRAPPRNAA